MLTYIYIVTCLGVDEHPGRATTVRVFDTEKKAEEDICYFHIENAEQIANDDGMDFYEVISLYLEGEKEEPQVFFQIHEVSLRYEVSLSPLVPLQQNRPI